MPAKKMSVYLSLAPEKQVTRNVIQTEIVFPITKDKKARSSMESLMLRIKEMISPRRKLTWGAPHQVVSLLPLLLRDRNNFTTSKD